MYLLSNQWHYTDWQPNIKVLVNSTSRSSLTFNCVTVFWCPFSSKARILHGGVGRALRDSVSVYFFHDFARIVISVNRTTVHVLSHLPNTRVYCGLWMRLSLAPSCPCVILTRLFFRCSLPQCLHFHASVIPFPTLFPVIVCVVHCVYFFSCLILVCEYVYLSVPVWNRVFSLFWSIFFFGFRHSFPPVFLLVLLPPSFGYFPYSLSVLHLPFFHTNSR